MIMMTSKDLLEQAGLSRATLNNYIAAGLLPKPEVRRASPAPGEPLTTLGYFPDWALERVMQIQSMKKAGFSMQAISQKLIQTNTQPVASKETITKASPTAAMVRPTPELGAMPLQLDHSSSQSLFDADTVTSEPPSKLDNKYKNHEVKDEIKGEFSEKKLSEGRLHLSIENLPYPAYLINYDFHVIWLNDASKNILFSNATIPERIEERSLIPTLLNWSADMTLEDKMQLFAVHFGLLKSRFNQQTLQRAMGPLAASERNILEKAFNRSAVDNNFFEDSVLRSPTLGLTRVVTMGFREGILVTYVPESENAGELMDWLSRRDHVIKSLLGQRLPVLTPLASIVADLQNSVRICAELPPDEYFQLINDIWSVMDPIFRKHYGAYGKHTGDGMVYYFFPQPDKNYLLNALQCACEIRGAMRKISHDWAHKKNWTNQLYMNIGICEGEEWLGTFKTTTSYELVVLGETINIAARLSDLARFGKIWATKSLVSKLSPEERELLDYGVTRTGIDQEVYVANSYAQVASLINQDDPKGNKLMDIASCAVTEIRGLR